MTSAIVKKYDFTGKVALITGSSAGIGAAIACQFAEYGADVVITGRSLQGLNRIAQKIMKKTDREPLVIVGDLQTDEHLPSKLIDETISKFGRLDFLVNSAGGSTPHRDLSDEKLLEGYDEVYAVNVRAIIQLTQLAVPHLEKTKGNIINISSASSMVPVIIFY